MAWDRVTALRPSSAFHESAVNHYKEEEGFGEGVWGVLKLFFLSSYKLNKQINKTFSYLMLVA